LVSARVDTAMANFGETAEFGSLPCETLLLVHLGLQNYY